MSAPAAASKPSQAPEATALQRARAALLDGLAAVVGRLPERWMAAIAWVLGGAWYLVTPSRAARARSNLERVVAFLAARGSADANAGASSADPRLQAAAHDPRALEALVRSAYRHAVRYYLDMIRVQAIGKHLPERLVIEDQELVDRAFDPARPAIFVGLHFGAIELPAMYLSRRSGHTTTVPMETLADPALQAWILRTRRRAGLRIVSLEAARRELRAALERGEPIGLIADRDLTGNGVPIELFGATTRLPAGPALLAIETGAPIFVAAVRRSAGGRWHGQLRQVPLPAEGPRRDRIVAILSGIARAFEDLVAAAPDQWWSVFHPIWDDAPGDRR